MDNFSSQIEAIYASSRRDLYVFAVRSTGNEDLATDIVQDAILNFIKMFRNRPLIPDLKSRIYLFKIARNLILNHYRKASTRRDLSGKDLDGLRSEQKTPEQIVIEEEELKRAEKALPELLLRLNETERTAILLYYNHDFHQEDIAAILNVSVPTISRLLKKGITSLQRDGKKLGIDFDLIR